MIYYVIPARRGSKGLPFKNRKLFGLTANTIPSHIASSVIVSTDDEQIADSADTHGFKVHNRSAQVSLDTTNTRDLLREVAQDFSMGIDDDIIMLYLTYPQRTFEDVQNIHQFFNDNSGSSLLCKQAVKDHPYMCYYSLSNHRGKRVVDHDLYRRQDYPECFFVSYFVAIVKVEHLSVVNKNLHHPQTLFYQLDYQSIDIDTEADLGLFLKERQ